MKKYNLFTGIMILCMALFLLTSAAFAEEAGGKEITRYLQGSRFTKDDFPQKCEHNILPRKKVEDISLIYDKNKYEITYFTENLQQRTDDLDEVVYIALFASECEGAMGAAYEWVGKIDIFAEETDPLTVVIKAVGEGEKDQTGSDAELTLQPEETAVQAAPGAEATPAQTEMETADDILKEAPVATESVAKEINIVIEEERSVLRSDAAYLYAAVRIENAEIINPKEIYASIDYEGKSKDIKNEELNITPGEGGVYFLKATEKENLGDTIKIKVIYEDFESEEKELTVEAAKVELKDILIERKGDALTIEGMIAPNFDMDDLPQIVIAEDDDTENNQEVELELVELKDSDQKNANIDSTEDDSAEVDPTEGAHAEQLQARQVYYFTCRYDLKNTDAKKLHMTVKLDSDALGEYDVDIPEKKALSARACWENAENTITYDAKKHGLQLQVRTDANADWQNVSVDQNGAFSVTIGDDQFAGTVYHKADDKEKADKEETNEIAGLPGTERGAGTYTYDLRIASDNYEVSWEGQTEGEYVKAEYTIEKKSIAVAVKAEQKDVPEYNGEEQTIEFNFVANLNEEEELNSELQHEVEDEVLKGVADYCRDAYAEDPLKGTDADEYNYDANAMVEYVRDDSDERFNNYAVTVDIEGEIIGRIDKAPKHVLLSGKCEYDGKPHSIISQVLSDFEEMENTLKSEEYIEGEEYSNNTLKDLREKLKKEYTDAGVYNNSKYKPDYSYCVELNKILKNYKYEIDWKLRITKKDISALAGNIKLDAGQVSYDGTEHTPKVIVRDFGKELAEGTDYLVKYYTDDTYKNQQTDFVNPGTTCIKVIGKGNYRGEYLLGEPFKIRKRTKDQIEASVKIELPVYDGTSAEKHVKGYIDGNEMNPEFCQWYKNDTKLDEAPKDAGTYKVKAEWSETKTREACSAEANFEIEQKSLKDGFEIKLTPESIEADGNAPYKPTTIKVIHGDNVLEEDVDYKLVFSGNTAQIGTVTVTAKGINNYTGEIQEKYSIITPAPTPTTAPTATPTVAPTATPTPEPTATPTSKPTATPTPEPTVQPVFNADSGTTTGKGGNDAKDADASAPNATEETGAMRIFADKQLLFLSAAAIVSLIAFVFCLIACKRQKQDLEKARFKTLDHQSRRSNRTIHQENDEG